MQMHPYMAEAIARQQVADWHSAAAQSWLARDAADGRAPRRRRLTWPLFGRRYRRVELVWPDGVCSVVSAPRPAASADHHVRGLTGSRR